MGAVAAASRRAAAQDEAEKLKRVGCMSGCFSSLLTEVRDWSQPASPKHLDIMDFPQMLADRFGIHNVEVRDRRRAMRCRAGHGSRKRECPVHMGLTGEGG
jgi:hypothetical protein